MSSPHDKEPRKLYGIRMRISLADKVREQGKRERRSLANMIEVACEQYLEAIKEKSKIID